MAPASPHTGDAGARSTAPVVLGERYQLADLLGRGGMADVHRATDLLLHRDVAVKVLRDVAGSDSDRARFTAEARTLAGLSHHALVTVLDAGLAGAASERPFLVMELVEGTTLAEVVRGGPVPLDRVGAIGQQVAEALAYAHGRGVVHRDVKPSNVLLDDHGRVKLADFGIAKLLGDSAGHTRTGMTIGSAAYLSPEQVQGEPVTGAADVYSLGLVLLEAITAERAYRGAPMEAAVARLHRSPDLPADLPAPWRDLLMAMTTTDAGARPSAEEVARRLRGGPGDEAATAAPPPADEAAERTRLLTTQVPPTPPAAPAPATTATAATAPARPAGPSAIDRAGDALAGSVRGLRDRAAAMPPHQRGVAAAIAALLLLIVVVALAAGGSGSGDEVPAETPRRLEQPLRDLHDAVHGRTP